MMKNQPSSVVDGFFFIEMEAYSRILKSNLNQNNRVVV